MEEITVARSKGGATNLNAGGSMHWKEWGGGHYSKNTNMGKRGGCMTPAAPMVAPPLATKTRKEMKRNCKRLKIVIIETIDKNMKNWIGHKS